MLLLRHLSFGCFFLSVAYSVFLFFVGLVRVLVGYSMIDEHSPSGLADSASSYLIISSCTGSG